MSATAPKPQLIARGYHDHAHGAPVDHVSLDYDARFLRRKVLTTDLGQRLLLDLPQTTSLNHGGVLLLDGRVGEIAVRAAAEPLLEVRAGAKASLTRLAWHIGNRHTPCQIEDQRLLIQRDHVIRDMLAQLGAEVAEITEAFRPEGGAYGHGRTHAHDHSHPHAHDHTHDHTHGHDPDHGRGHSHDH